MCVHCVFVQIHQRLCQIAGKEAVQAAILHVLRQPLAEQPVKPEEAPPTSSNATLPCHDAGMAETTEMAPSTATATDGVPHVGHELAHAAYCTDGACDQPNCRRMKAKLVRLQAHAATCTEARCLPCTIWNALEKRRARGDLPAAEGPRGRMAAASSVPSGQSTTFTCAAPLRSSRRLSAVLETAPRGVTLLYISLSHMRDIMDMVAPRTSKYTLLPLALSRRHPCAVTRTWLGLLSAVAQPRRSSLDGAIFGLSSASLCCSREW